MQNDTTNEFEEIIMSTKNKRLVKVRTFTNDYVYEIHVRKGFIFKKWVYPYSFTDSWYVTLRIAKEVYNHLKK